MRSVIIGALIGILGSSIVCSFKAEAAPANASRRISVTRKMKYSTQSSILIQQGLKWICQTELSKRVPVVALTPRSLKSILAFEKSKPQLDQATCKDQVFLDDTLVSGEKVFMACATDPAAAALLDSLGEDCGRR